MRWVQWFILHDMAKLPQVTVKLSQVTVRLSQVTTKLQGLIRPMSRRFMSRSNYSRSRLNCPIATVRLSQLSRLIRLMSRLFYHFMSRSNYPRSQLNCPIVTVRLSQLSRLLRPISSPKLSLPQVLAKLSDVMTKLPHVTTLRLNCIFGSWLIFPCGHCYFTWRNLSVCRISGELANHPC